ncbi:MAG: hypothetical protein R2827_01200 [Bdellovibrionales bacterium]
MNGFARLIVFTFLVILSSNAFGYIPRFEMIVDRLGRNHGYGYYLIDQEVVIPAQPTPYIVKEQWLINTDGSFRLRVKGERELRDKLDITIVYNGMRKHYVDASGAVKSTQVGSEFADPLFFWKSTDKIIDLLRQFKVQLPDYKSLEKLVNADSNTPINPGRSETLNLARVGGTTAYAIGRLTDFGQAEKEPAIWIEQDQFNILKIRLPSQTEVVAKEYGRHARGLYFPKSRTIQTTTGNYQINLRQIKPVDGGASNRALLSRASLDPKKYPHIKLKLPDIDAVKTFYQKYR